MLSIWRIRRSSQCLLKDLVAHHGAFASMKVVFYYLFGGGIVKIIVS
jgi:hypothetical protein